jgi:diguanylate cyclase (GGDEF)-like protein/PAS domain S-box-containing protein
MEHSTSGYGRRAMRLGGLLLHAGLLFVAASAAAGERRYYFDRHDSAQGLVHMLRVRASNGDGAWSDAVASLPVTVQAWWSSNAMRLAYAMPAALLLLALWRMVRRRQRQKLRHHAELQRRDERFRMALWGSGDEFWDLDFTTKTMYRIGGDQNFGGNYEQAIADDSWLREMTHPDDYPLLLQRRRDHIEGRTPIFESEHRVRGANGEWVWRLSRGKIVEWSADGKPLRACGTARNVTETHLADRQQRIAAQVINSMTEAVCVTDLDLRCVTVNQAFTLMTGYAEAEILGQSVVILHGSRQSAQSYQSMCEETVRNGHWRGEVWQRRKNGEEFLAWLEISAVYDAASARTHYVSVMNDITDRKRAEQDLRYLANYDTLTGLPNRTLLIERLSAAIGRARRDGARVAVLFIDLDRFKHVNDSMGHISGDLMLNAVGVRLRACMGENDTVARIGGDEFTVLLEGLSDAVEAVTAAQSIIEALSAPLELEIGCEMVITPSIGISLYPDHAHGPMNMLKFADTAMYQAKEQGRNTFMVYTPAMDASSRHLANTAAALRKAIELNEMSVVYQPKLSLINGRISGVETLLRWHSDELGDISPAQFIPLAEQTGLIVELGQFALRSACVQLRQWRQLGLSDLSIAINVSVLQLLRGELATRLHQLVEENGLDPAKLQLELTESMLMARAGQTLGMLDELKAVGVTLAIDDFGTGYSSLSYLKRLPIDTLKIDRAFVHDIATDAGDRAITATIITMAHSLGLDVVAEGVETVEQLDYLRAQGCDEIQGDWVSPPLDAEACTEFLLSGARLPLRAVAAR